MAAPRADWIDNSDARQIVRHETRLLGPEADEALLSALQAGAIRARRTVTKLRLRDGKPVAAHEGDPMELSARFWDNHPSLTWAMNSHNSEEIWDIEIHYAELLGWLQPGQNSGQGKRRGRPPTKDLDTFWIKAVLLANMPDGLPEKQTEFIECMAQKYHPDDARAPSDSWIKQKAQMLYAEKDRK